MSTMSVGKRLVELCRQGQFMEAIKELYDKNVVSVEALSMGPQPRRMEGIGAVTEKSVQFMKNTEVHSLKVSDALPHDDRFIVIMELDCTSKAGPMAGKRMQMTEACLYTVKNDKIVHEEFFYGGGDCPEDKKH